MSTDAHATAIKALLATATQAPVYDHDDAQTQAALPAGLPATFTIIYLSPRFGGPVRGETRDTNLRRLQTRPAARTVTNVRLIEDRIAAAFLHTTIDLGDTFAHFAYETGGGSYKADEGYYTDLSSFTFAV